MEEDDDVDSMVDDDADSTHEEMCEVLRSVCESCVPWSSSL